SLCTDAFHHLHRKRDCVDELRRCTAGGTLVFAGVGNRLVEPLEGEECTPEEYAALLEPWPHRVRHETELVDGYLQGVGPDLALPVMREASAGGKWLYFVATQDDSILREHGPFDAWPHATGQLALNPLYDRKSEDGTLTLSFRFPSPWYAFENARMADYHPETATLDAEVLADVAANRRSTRVIELIARFVVLGLPLRYARRSGRPRAMVAHRTLTFLVRDLVRAYRGTARGYRTEESGRQHTAGGAP
ncbi:MAG TPA: hypothetical protein VD962_10885, partial [Rubricoccaceae bacterium]|nr:hypothetical protein [Rubricoccaceae bacterium]